MSRTDFGLEKSWELRLRAEEVAKSKDADRPSRGDAVSPEETQEILHELRVHQIELEIQNEEMRNSQIEMKSMRARYFDLYDLAPVGYFTLDVHGLILEANLTAATLLRTTRSQLTHHPISQFILPTDLKTFAEHCLRLSQTGMPQACELWMRRGDGEAAWMRVEATVARSHESGPQYRMVLSDLTDRKQAEEEKHKLESQLQQAKKMESLGSLAGGVAHDMNNVLGAILGMASLHLETRVTDSPTQQAFATISKAAMRGGKMVKNLLHFARQSLTGDLELDVNDLLNEEVLLLMPTTLSKVQLELDLDPDLRRILGDGVALSHMFMNLFVNAVDAMPESGTLTLQTRNVDNCWIEVRINDTGRGMAKEVLDRAFDPFFTTKEVGKGTGLGLSMAFSTVQAHRGQIEMQSELGIGTQVRLRFPACELEAPVQKCAEPGPVIPEGVLKVLVVDDDELIQSSMAAILGVLGHDATVVPCGEAALALLAAGMQPDVVILDVNMPGLGGILTLARIRESHPRLRVLLATGRADDRVSHALTIYSGVTILPKPFSLREFQRHLESLTPKQ